VSHSSGSSDRTKTVINSSMTSTSYYHNHLQQSQKSWAKT